MIEEVRIDSDERGFLLELVGDFSDAVEAYEADDGYRLRLRLPQDAALALLAAAVGEVGPWAAEGARELAAYRAASDEERTAVLRLRELWPSRSAASVDAETLADWADAARKRARGE